mgnify:CR=1 FL=1
MRCHQGHQKRLSITMIWQALEGNQAIERSYNDGADHTLCERWWGWGEVPAPWLSVAMLVGVPTVVMLVALALVTLLLS